MNIFLYGTLLYEPLLKQVAGLSRSDAIPSKLSGVDIFASEDGTYPVIVEGSGAWPGILLRDVEDEALARMDYYEGAFDYVLKSMQVVVDGQAEQAQVYWPTHHIPHSGQAWDLATWEGTWGPLAARTAREAMSYRGQLDPQEMAAKYGQMRVRAAAFLAAEDFIPSTELSLGDVEVVEERTPYINFFMLQELDLKHRRFDGGWSPTITRAAFVGGDAAILLPYDPVRDRVLVIEQFRTPPFVRGDPAPWMMEAVAGRVDPGETPEEAAHREAFEEARLTLSRLEKVGASYPTPGSSTEYFHLFIGLTDLPDGVETLAGVDGENEDIRTSLLSFDALMEMADAGQIRVEPLLTCALWLARHRDRLRKGG